MNRGHYGKPTDTGQYLNLESNHSLWVKPELTTGLVKIPKLFVVVKKNSKKQNKI